MRTLALFSALAMLLVMPSCETVPVAGGEKSADATCNGAKTHSWKAWANLMPGSSKDVHVTGKISVPTGGWKAKLAKRSPQGINVRILQLELHVTPPSGIATQVLTEFDVKYTEKGGASLHDRVEIFCGSDRIADVPIEQVH
jgi:hypothetical protein